MTRLFTFSTTTTFQGRKADWWYDDYIPKDVSWELNLPLDVVKTKEFDPSYDGLRKHIVQRYLEISNEMYEVACKQAEDTERWAHQQFGDQSESFADRYTPSGR